MKMLAAAIDILIEVGTERRLVSHLDAFLNLWKSVRDVRRYESLIKKIFEDSMDHRLLSAFGRYVKTATKSMVDHYDRSIVMDWRLEGSLAVYTC